MSKKEAGMTLIALIILVIILIIIISITAYVGMQVFKNTEVETFETDMLTIKAKAKTYGEELETALWAYSGDEKEEKKNELVSEYGLTLVENIDDEIINQLSSEITENEYEIYSIESLLEDSGLNEIQESEADGQYLVIYSAEDYTNLDVAYTEGVLYNGSIYYTLSKLQEVYLGE